MIRKLMMFGLMLSILTSCEKDFDVVEEEVIDDVTIETISFSYNGDCFLFVYNNQPYLLTDDSKVYEINEENNTIQYINDISLSGSPIGAIQEIDGRLFVATERYVYKLSSYNFSSLGIYNVPSSSYGQIVSFSVIDNIAIICHANNYVFKNTSGFINSSSLLFNLKGARSIETGGKSYIYSENEIYVLNNNTWQSLVKAADIVSLSGKSKGSLPPKITGLISDGNGKLLVSYINKNLIYTDLIDEAFQTSTNYTKIGTSVLQLNHSSSLVMGESFLLDGGAFFNFEYQLRSSYTSTPYYPYYDYYSSASASSASLNIKGENVQGVVNPNLKHCISPIKLNNKIYTYNKSTAEVVIVSE